MTIIYIVAHYYKKTTGKKYFSKISLSKIKQLKLKDLKTFEKKREGNNIKRK